VYNPIVKENIVPVAEFSILAKFPLNKAKNPPYYFNAN
jgi:hypothetical protein